MNKKYYLKNEKGQVIDVNDLKNSVFNLTSDIGTSRDITYSRVGNTFIKSKEELNQPKIEGVIKFIKSESENEENYKIYEKFFKTSKEIVFVNIRNEAKGFIESFVDVDWGRIGRIITKGNVLTCNIELYCKTGWYKQNNITYTIEESQANAYGFPIDFENMIFSKGNENRNVINNVGYYEAPMYIKIKGPVLNPKIEVIKDNKVINCLEIPIELEEFEEIEYCSRDDKLLIQKINADGTKENIFDLLDATNNNFFKVPIGASVIKISAESDIKYAIITIYIQY